MDPPAAILEPRIAIQDTELSGIFIPKGTSLTIDLYNLYIIQRSGGTPINLFLVREADQLTKLVISSAVFSNVSRICIGINFSFLEQWV